MTMTFRRPLSVALARNRFSNHQTAVPPASPGGKHMANIRTLAKNLDRADSEVAWMWATDRKTFTFTPDSVPLEEYTTACDRLHAATTAYGAAAWDRARAARDKFRDRKSIPATAKFAVKLRGDKYEAMYQLDAITERGYLYKTEREVIDANIVLWLADQKYEIAQEKYQSEEAMRRRQNRADKAAGVVRITRTRRNAGMVCT
jgi:hypothetical protein